MVNGQPALMSTPRLSATVLANKLHDSAASPVGSRGMETSPSWAGNPSRDVQALGSIQRHQCQSLQRRQSSRWARTHDGRLRSTLAVPAEEDADTAEENDEEY